MGKNGWCRCQVLSRYAIISSPCCCCCQYSRTGRRSSAKGQPSVTLDDALRPDTSYEQFQDLLRHYERRKSIIVAGHNPNESEFLSYLISGGTTKESVELKKGAVAKVDYLAGRGTLVWCITPKLLNAAQESAKTSSRPKTSRK